MTSNFSGLTAAVHTPFDSSGALAVQRVSAQAQFLVDRGVEGAFVAGTTGEWPSLTVAERMDLAETWAAIGPATGLKVVIHTGHSSLEDAQSLAGHAAGLGVDAISALAPSFLRPPSIDALVDWCTRVSQPASGLPFFYYHIPALTRLPFPMVDFLQIAPEKIPNFAGIKFTSTDFEDLDACIDLKLENVEILFGTDENVLQGFQAGCRGAVGSSYNFASPLHLELIQAYESGEGDEAKRLQERVVELICCLQEFGYIPAAKQLMGRMGVELGTVRPPLVPVPEVAMEELEGIIRRMDYLDWGEETL